LSVSHAHLIKAGSSGVLAIRGSQLQNNNDKNTGGSLWLPSNKLLRIEKMQEGLPDLKQS